MYVIQDALCRAYYRSYKKTECESLKFIMSHAGCRVLEKKLKNAREALLNLEFEMFCKMIT